MNDKEIFPEEILNNTVESHIIKHNKKTSRLFVITFLALLIAFVSLPFIYIDIYTTSRGTIIPQEKKLTLYSPISGKISFFKVEENQKIKKVLTSNTSNDVLILIHLPERCIFFAPEAQLMMFWPHPSPQPGLEG